VERKRRVALRCGVANDRGAQRLLEETVSATTLRQERWINQAESGMTLADFQAVHALAEKWQSSGRIELLETEVEEDTGKHLTLAIKFRRLE
jgi:phage shock protein A